MYLDASTDLRAMELVSGCVLRTRCTLIDCGHIIVVIVY